MSPGVSRKVEGIAESQTLALTAKAQRLRRLGVDIVSLTAGEPDVPTPAHVRQAATRAIEDGFTRYTANEGMPELIEAVIEKFRRDNGLEYSPEQILVSSGAKHSIYNALQAICDPDDEIIILAPYWVSYPDMVKLADAVPVIVPSAIEEGFLPNFEAVRKACSPRTRGMIINTPINPTGLILGEEFLRRVAALAKEKEIYIISDEIYEKVIYGSEPHCSIGAFPGAEDLVVTVNGVSKAYAMTGWRIGFLGGPVPVVRAAAKVQGQTTSNANSIAQKAAIAALRGSDREIVQMVADLRERRDLVYHELASIPGVDVILPEGALYFFFGVGNFIGRKSPTGVIENSTDLVHHLLDHHHVALVPGAAFGDDRCIRLSFSCSREVLKAGLLRIREGLANLY